MSCDHLEPLIVLDSNEHIVMRHRRDCESAVMSKEDTNDSTRVMNQTEFYDSAVRGGQGLFLHVPTNHLCMKRRSLHLARAEYDDWARAFPTRADESSLHETAEYDDND